VKRIAAAALSFAAGAACAAQEGTFALRMMTPETALKAAQAALAKCRGEGYQVTVAVVDRSGIAQALVRDRLAGAHTVDIAQRKAQTAAGFRMDTATLERETQAGRPAAGLRNAPSVLAVAGGRPIEAAGSVIGAIGVSGAPGPANDDACAAAGIAAIAEDLEF
jgi:uncharacterized protein GlcG (DUF336 family)